MGRPLVPSAVLKAKAGRLMSQLVRECERLGRNLVGWQRPDNRASASANVPSASRTAAASTARRSSS
jgi:hypothetical protein